MQNKQGFIWAPKTASTILQGVLNLEKDRQKENPNRVRFAHHIPEISGLFAAFFVFWSVS